tara:strand:- start:2700 stop:2891 length:192 start_codon:yes stop_codon:yes gene_type:complete
MARTRKQARRLGLDRRYLDAPRFPVIIEYEQEFQKQYKKNMKNMMKDVNEKLLQLTKQEKKKT